MLPEFDNLSVRRSDLRLHLTGITPEFLSGPSIFLVPGYTDHAGRYPDTFKYFAERGHPVWGMDLRGHGRSGGRRGGLRRFGDYLDDLQAALEAVVQKAPAPWVLLGHSTGGLIVLSALIRRQRQLREAGVVGAAVTSPLLEIALKTPPWRRLLGQAASALFPALSLTSGVPPYANSHDPAVEAAKLADPLCFTAVNARWYPEVRREMVFVNAHGADIRLPLMVLQAGDDKVVVPQVAQTFAARVPGAEFTAYPEMYHEILLETDRARVWAALDGFLERLG